MFKEGSESTVTNKWKSFMSGIMMRNFTSLRKIDKYFRMNISDSMAKAIEENWLRILGIDYEIISVNLSRDKEPLGIALQGRNIFSRDGQEMIQRHFLKAIIPYFCIGSSKMFFVGDELLEVNGFKIYGMKSKEVVSALKKLPNNIQFVVARAISSRNDDISDYGGSEDIHSPISFYEMDEDISSHTSTMKSNSSLFSSTSRDYGSSASVAGLIDRRQNNVSEYLRTIIGWRGPIVVEFRKRHKESLGLALEEIKDPTSCHLITVFKILLPEMKAAKDGRLHVGDRLLQVNGKSVNGVAFRKVCQWMKSAPGGRLVLYVCKPHFPAINTDNVDFLSDNYLYQTLSEQDRLPQLQEEESNDIPPVPESFENYIFIKGNGEKLGCFLDIADKGVNGCRIKKIARGPVKSNGILCEGDYVTMINDISLRISDRNVLDNCIRKIGEHRGDYNISFLRKETIDMHKLKYSRSNSEKVAHFNIDVCASDDLNEPLPEAEKDDRSLTRTMYFDTVSVTIDNDRTSNLGLVLLPSLNNPTRYSSIAQINPDSLAAKSQLLKINDELLSVNEQSLQSMFSADVGLYLKDLMRTEAALHFKVRRFRNADDAEKEANKYSALSSLPDFYFCTLSKSQGGFGFSVLPLNPGIGVIIGDIKPDSPACKSGVMKSGHRIVLINNCQVSSSPIDVVVKMVKNSQKNISLLMETPKVREFDVLVAKDSSNSLGLNIAGGIDTKSPQAIIESVVPDTSCQYSETLQSDDVIVAANKHSLLDLIHNQIITLLRSLPHESTLRVRRLVPFSSRPLLLDLDNPISMYTDHFSVIISKPTSNIQSFGITFTDIVILDPETNTVRQRYKAVISIEENSLCEKYAPEIVPNCYLCAINGAVVEENIDCDDVKRMIDRMDHVELRMSRDIPYDTESDRSGEYQSLPDASVVRRLQCGSISDGESTSIDQLPDSEDILDHGHYTNLTSYEARIVTPIINVRGSDEISISDSSSSDEFPPPPPEPAVYETLGRDFGITVHRVTVPKSDCIEVGFRVIGGVNGGPAGETLPVYVVAVERNTCNWPADRSEPWLSNGVQLLELNGRKLSSMECSEINRLICSLGDDLTFKVVKFTT